MIDAGLKKEIEGLMIKFPCIDSAILPSLTLIQERKGFISQGDMEELSRILKFSQARIFSVASFYSMLKLRPRGKYHLQVCTNISCSLLREKTLMEHLSRILGIGDGETTGDGLFSLEAVECLGSCGYAPAMMINSDHFENLGFDQVDRIIESLREKERAGGV
ncbi:MAG: NAD(P)H-dependent oxidoreductase subunit E [Nitrospiraceae bacterium]|nr:MAG: NAD(P)H-dependent oxidoreductase subunit E [Nitrospiraceae bacterium]